jgi:hypothetical protein
MTSSTARVTGTVYFSNAAIHRNPLAAIHVCSAMTTATIAIFMPTPPSIPSWPRSATTRSSTIQVLIAHQPAEVTPWMMAGR